MSVPIVLPSVGVSVALLWRRRARSLGGTVARPFSGIPLALGDATYRPLFLFFLALGSAAGLWLNFVSVWLAQNLGATPAQVGWFFSVSFLAAALGNFSMPMLAERIGSRKSVALGLMAIGVPGAIGMAFANGYWMALISITPLWFGAGLFALLIGLAGDVARARAGVGERDQSGTVIAALQTAMAVGMTLSPLLGGWLYEQTGQLRPGVLLALVPHLVATWILWRYVREDREDRGEGPQAPAQKRGSPSQTSGKLGLALLTFLVLSALFRLGDARAPFESLYAAQELGASKAQVGLLITTLAALQLVLTPVMGRLTDRVGAGRMTAAGILCLSVHGFLLAGSTSYWQQLVLLVLTAAGLAIGSSAAFVYAQQLAPGRAATATGWLNACFFLGLMGGSALAGRVVELAGFRGLFVFSGAMDLASAALTAALVVIAARSAGPGRTESAALHARS
ncbi:MAG TPA: MFS transporter [Chloroflexota bacterium]|nr:MFS transporter [Chloroflexota bacterium]